MDRDALQRLLAQGVSVEQIGRKFGRHPSTVSYWMRKHGLEAPNRAKHAGRGGLDRDELELAVRSGLSIAEIAQRFGRSKGTWSQRPEDVA
jgi:IS30 family transposase